MHTSMTRLSQALFAITLLLLIPAAVSAQLRAEVVAEGFARPVAIAADPLSPGTLIVAEHGGLVWAVVGGVRQATPFLDVTAELKNDGVEQGFLGLAFHPSGDRVFVSFTKLRTPDDGIGDTVIRRYRRSGSNPLVLDPASKFDLVWAPGGPSHIVQRSTVHRGGDMHFGPDGYLYVGIGDSGSASLPPAGGHSQHPGSLLGKFIRIDVDVPDSDPRGYTVPADNPFLPYVQQYGVMPEIWSFGFRNPWRWSFDDFGTGSTGAMIIGDVGEFDREEIDYEPAGRGGRNYGWYVREGSIPTPGRTPTPPAFEPLTPPIADYPRSIGRSVTGGFVYRGSALPVMYQGRYFVADFFGRVFSLGLSIAPSGEAQVTDAIDHTAELGSPRLISTFGRGLDGELYYASFVGGRILRIAPSTIEAPAPPVSATSEVSGSTVRISWQNGATGGSPTSFVLEAGSQPGAANLLVTSAPFSPLVVEGVPNGLYYVRVRAVNALGTSAPSNEVEVLVGCIAPPAAPPAPVATVSGNTVALQWTAAAQATSYIVEAGSAPGLADFAAIPAGTTSLGGPVPPGTYYVRVRAVNQCGTGTPSEEIVVTVP